MHVLFPSCLSSLHSFIHSFSRNFDLPSYPVVSVLEVEGLQRISSVDTSSNKNDDHHHDLMVMAVMRLPTASTALKTSSKAGKTLKLEKRKSCKNTPLLSIVQ